MKISPRYQSYRSLESLCWINLAKAQGPDSILGWLLKKNADLLAPPILDFLNTSFCEGRLPLSWKKTGIVPVSKQRPIQDVNKDLRSISLKPIMSEIAEDYVVHNFVMQAVLKKIDKKQYGTIPKLCTTHVLVSMIHNWYVSSDGNAATIRVVLFEFRKAFNIINHSILVRKPSDNDIRNHILWWITDFHVDNTTISEVADKGHESCIHQVVDDLAWQARDGGFQLNERRFKELRISVARNEPEFDPICVNRQTLETVNNVKLLILILSSDLKLNVHVSELVRKVSTRLCFLRQLKKIGCCCQRANSILHHMYSLYSGVRQPRFSLRSTKLERLQKRAMKIIYPAQALELCGLLFDEIWANQSHSLQKLLSSKYQPMYSLKDQRTFIRPKK